MMRVRSLTGLETRPIGVRRPGIGAYPDQTSVLTGQNCYDPARPWWLPYWLDTPTESACLYGNKSESIDLRQAQAAGYYPNPPLPVPVPAPPEGIVSGPGGTVTRTPEEILAEQAAAQAVAQAAQTQDFFGNMTLPNPTKTDYTGILIMAGIVVGGIFLVKG